MPPSEVPFAPNQGTAFITGAGGFVGINVVRGLAERGWRVIASATGIYAAQALGHPRDEGECHQGHNLYAVCKLASEGLLRSYAEIHGLSLCSVRIGSVYGPLERPSHSRAGLSLVARLLPWAGSPNSNSVIGDSRL